MSLPGTKIKRNSFFALLSQGLRLVTNVVLFVGIARSYGPVEFGQFTAAHTLSTVFLLFADFGFDLLLTTEVARHREQAAQITRTFLSSKLIFAASATVAMVITASLYAVSVPTRMLMYVFSLYVTFNALSNFFFALFKGFDEFHHETWITFVTNTLLLGVVVVLGMMHASLVTLAVAFVLSRVASTALAMNVAHTRVSLRDFRLTAPSKAQFSMISVFGLEAIFTSLIVTQDTLLLSLWKGDREVGIYQSIYKLISVIFIIPTVVVNAMLPSLSRYFEEDRGRWQFLARLTGKMLFLVGLPISGILFVFADQIVDLLYGAAQFGEAIPILRIFSLVAFVQFASVSYAYLLTSARRQSFRMRIAFAGALINLLMNFYAIPRYGPFGAAIVSLGTVTFIGVWYVLGTRPYLVLGAFDAHYFVPGLTMLAAAFLCWQFRTFPAWYVAPLPLALYVAVAYTMGFTGTERRTIFVEGESPLLTLGLRGSGKGNEQK